MTSDVDRQIEAMSDVEVMAMIDYTTDQPGYEESGYTPMVKDITDRGQRFGLSKRQRGVLETHLRINKRLWY